MTGKILRLLRVERNVADLEGMTAFYRDALGFVLQEPVVKQQDFFGQSIRVAKLHLGDQQLWLTCFDTPGCPYPPDSISSDLSFQHCAIVVSDMQAAYERLKAYPHVPISANGPVTLPPATGKVAAYKFRDSEGHPLELIYFPPGTGDARWQVAGDGPTLGIDHSAISVADADASIKFYRDILGLTVAARQINSGPAQDALDALPDSNVTVVALESANATPHIELLGYEHPRGRVAAPTEILDIAADRLVLMADDSATIISRLRQFGHAVITGSGPALFHDPDGHLLLIDVPRHDDLVKLL